jgi:putative ubiquitin-RnfH superfamily antitoxin RatB of RatAB toxin-antitoxin module
MNNSEMIVEVAYALPKVQLIIPVKLSDGATVEQAIKSSGIEIYRSLIADPKEVRKQRVADGKVMKKGGGDAPPERVS